MASRQDSVQANLYEPQVKNRLRLAPFIIDAGAAEVTIPNTVGPAIFCDPGGGAVDMLLPAEEAGLAYFIANTADAAEAITVKEDSETTTIITLAQGECGWVVCDGTTWYGFVGANT